MYAPLSELEELNANCRIQLTKTLSRQHNVRVVAGKGEETDDRCRGLAFFLAFDPWHTCLRCPPGAARFLDAAEKTGLLSAKEAKDLSHALIYHGAEMARVYNGVFSPFFSESRVRTILDNLDNLDHLSESALAIGGSWADRLFETCPFPLYPSKHLEVQSFRKITIEGEIEFYSQSPWLAWIEALDLICAGPWAGFKSTSIMAMIKALEQRVVRISPEAINLDDAILGHKVTLPMFTRGLQGVVLGIFTDVPKVEMEPIITSLLQFGETISDGYADLRWKAFVAAMEEDLDEGKLAREIINIVSPIDKIVVSYGGSRAGYQISSESNYWAGYQSISTKQLDEMYSDKGFSVVGPNGAEIYIEPLSDIPHLNPEFTRIRLEQYLNRAFGSIAVAQNGDALSQKDVQQIRSEYEGYAQDPNTSLAKLRQYYVVCKIERSWADGEVKITNSEMKSFLETMGRDTKAGYQVSSFTSEFEKLFDGKVSATKTRNAVTLSWHRGA